MQDYNFWADLMDTSSRRRIGSRALWLIVPSAFVLGLIAFIMRYRLAAKGVIGDLIYTIHRDAFDQLHVYRHSPELGHEADLLLLEEELLRESDRF